MLRPEQEFLLLILLFLAGIAACSNPVVV